MANDDDKVFHAILAVAMIPVIITLNGYVLSVLWGWFVTPLGVSDLSVWQACGLAAIVGFLTNHNTSKDERSVGETILAAFLKPIIVLGFCAVYHMLMA